MVAFLQLWETGMGRPFSFPIAFLFGLLFSGAVFAQSVGEINTGGTLVVIPAYGEVRHANDEARVTFAVEEQDKDRTAAVNRVNQKMKEGIALLKREDATAMLETRGYYTHPVYADEGSAQRPPQTGQAVQRQLLGWRVGQQLDMKTSNLDALPRTVATAQRVLALNGLHFGLKEDTKKMLQEQQIAAAYANLVDRLQAAAKAMGRSLAEMELQTVDFEGNGNYAPEGAVRMMMSKAMDAGGVEVPSFEPGETTLTMRVVGRARLP